MDNIVARNTAIDDRLIQSSQLVRNIIKDCLGKKGELIDAQRVSIAAEKTLITAITSHITAGVDWITTLETQVKTIEAFDGQMAAFYASAIARNGDSEAGDAGAGDALEAARAVDAVEKDLGEFVAGEASNG